MKDGVGDISLHLRPQCRAYSIWFKQGRCQSGCKSTRLLTVLFSHLWESIESDIRQAYYGSWQLLVSNPTMPHICLLSCTWATQREDKNSLCFRLSSFSHEWACHQFHPEFLHLVSVDKAGLVPLSGPPSTQHPSAGLVLSSLHQPPARFLRALLILSAKHQI